MRISDWSSDVCSSDLVAVLVAPQLRTGLLHFDVLASIISVLGDLVRRTEVTDFQICQRHVRFSSAGPGRDQRGASGSWGHHDFWRGHIAPSMALHGPGLPEIG